MPSTALESLCWCGHSYEQHRQDLQGVHECRMPGCICEGFDEEDD